MESFYVKIKNPKAKSILKGLVNLNMITIQETEPTNKFSELLKKFRKNSDSLLSFNKTPNEAEAVREKSYGA
jgi:trehalose-6-phosphate synthase